MILRGKQIYINIKQVYTPTEDRSVGDSDNVNNDLKMVQHKNNDAIILLGDSNAKLELREMKI